MLIGGEELISSWGADALRRSFKESLSKLSKAGKSLTARGVSRVLVEADLSTDDRSRAKDRRDFLEERFDDISPLLPLGVEGADATSTSKPPSGTGCDKCSVRVHSGGFGDFPAGDSGDAGHPPRASIERRRLAIDID